jgi:hypothetical protein
VEGHWRELASTRYDEPYLRVERELRVAVLSHEYIQDTLLKIGPQASPSTPRTTVDRARRIYLVSAALREVLTYHEVDHYSSCIQTRREAGIWPEGEPPPSMPGFTSAYVGRDGGGKRKRRGPDHATITVAVDALAQCVRAARVGLAENLPQYERDALNRVVGFVGYSGAEARRRSGLVRSADAVKKRQQRQSKDLAPVVKAERLRLEREVEAGRMVRLCEYAYVNAD